MISVRVEPHPLIASIAKFVYCEVVEPHPLISSKFDLVSHLIRVVTQSSLLTRITMQLVEGLQKAATVTASWG